MNIDPTVAPAVAFLLVVVLLFSLAGIAAVGDRIERIDEEWGDLGLTVQRRKP